MQPFNMRKAATVKETTMVLVVFLGMSLMLKSHNRIPLDNFGNDSNACGQTQPSSTQIPLFNNHSLADVSSKKNDDDKKGDGTTEQERGALFSGNKALTNKLDASIMITSNLIPTHPHIGMLEDTIFSLHRFLKGIPFDTPIYVIVDGLRPKEFNENNWERRTNYIQNVREHNFAPFTNVQVVPMEDHRFLAGCVKFALENNIETEFLYIIQHDLPFCREVDHWRLLKTMREHPDVLFNVRFRYNNKVSTTGSHCKSYKNMSDFPKEDFNGLSFFWTNFFSDNNHLTTKRYYRYLLSNFKHYRRSMENLISWKSRYNCTYMGQQIYGRRDDGETHICHLNGRQAFGKKVDKTRSAEQSILCRNLIYGEMTGLTKSQDDA
ncbi:unnamed protein product [Cylindrotheca closterium]|uniref:Uncharacterized protein n=1 Tax=Cylindrotheca closterium TaxID=2856 RepID=A0AAD2JKM3_9STRA|nr:unnamed protein product [Cylindrotheca closterium]